MRFGFCPVSFLKCSTVSFKASVRIYDSLHVSGTSSRESGRICDGPGVGGVAGAG